MADGEKYGIMTDHDLLIKLAVMQDDDSAHLEKINGRLDSHSRDIVKLKIIIAVIIAGTGGGTVKLLSLLIGG